MKARYIRISYATQNTARQLIKSHPNEQLFIDVISGAIPFNERPQAAKLIEAIESGTINNLSVEAIDRLGRNAFDVQTTIEYLNTKGVNLRVENLGIESIVKGKPNSIFKLITDVLSNVAAMERESLKERQKQGIAIAVAQGKFKGRVKGSTTPDNVVLEQYKQVAKELKLQTNSLRKIASICGVSLGTVQKVQTILRNRKEL